MSWRMWPVWLSAEAAQRIEDKLDEMRRELHQIKVIIEDVDRTLRELAGRHDEPRRH